MNKSDSPAAPSGASSKGTRELITVEETAYKKRVAQRDQETFDMVRRHNETDSKYIWSAQVVGGKVRVTSRLRD